MTENNYNELIDAICELVNLAWDSTSKEEFERLDNAGADIVDCLEKLSVYEAIGTVEECDNAMCFELAKENKQLAEVIDDYLKYIKIGTIEEFKALKEKNETLKALYEDARKEGNNLLARERNKAIDEFVNTLIPRLTDAIYQKDVESTTNLINDVARELKAGGIDG